MGRLRSVEFACGHPRTEENVYTQPSNGSLCCRECMRTRARERYRLLNNVQFTTFKCGHEKSVENTYTYRGKHGPRTSCRACQRARDDAYNSRVRRIAEAKQARTKSGSGQFAEKITIPQYNWNGTRLG